MVNTNEIIARDLKHIWHPCTIMKDMETYPPLFIEKAQGSIIYTNKGPLIDATSSWWCKSLGHRHPAVISAIEKQLSQFEHVIGAHTTHEQRALFGELIAKITKKQHVFFASDGASAVEIAMKLALHTQQLKNNHNRTEFIALEHGYHGETLGTLSVSDLGLYKKPYADLGPKCHFITNIPYVSTKQDPLWADCSHPWQTILPQLEQVKEHACALIVEPLVQGAAGMKCYSADFLQRLAIWAQKNDILLIADEIMTGIGRTGAWLACDHAEVSPDLMCLSKGLTSGSIPFSCVAIDSSIYDLFYNLDEKHQNFLHSHTYSGNPLAIAAAVATLQTIESEHLIEKSEVIGSVMLQYVHDISNSTGKLHNIRGLGAIVAADLAPTQDGKIEQKIQQYAMEQGALLRPIGNTIYWLPPLNIDEKMIGNLAEITLNSINEAYKS